MPWQVYNSAGQLLQATDLPDNAVTNAKVADDAIGVAELSASGTASNSTFLRGDNSWASVDTTGIQANADDIAILAFQTQANGSLARYNLVDQSVDSFQTTAGVNLGTSTNENWNNKYFSGKVAGTEAFTSTGTW